jgi:pimeloyl-ACP methyl ester carboxylesterase
MAVLSQLRYPTTRRAKLISGLLALILFFFVATAIVAGTLLTRIVWPARTPAQLNVDLLLGHPSKVAFSVPGNGTREGIFFPGLRGAPTIVLCHGYSSQRADILTMVTTLQDHHYNVFLFDFSGHGITPGLTTFGYKEVGELRAAIEALSQRDDVDPMRFGVWGTDLGGYTALYEATSDTRVRALAVASVYEAPVDMVVLQVDRTGLQALPLVVPLCKFGFRMLNYRYRKEPRLVAGLSRLQGVPKLFIEVHDERQLYDSTTRLFKSAPDPRQQLVENASYLEMSDEERHTYENAIVTFFLQNLPTTATVSR